MDDSVRAGLIDLRRRCETCLVEMGTVDFVVHYAVADYRRQFEAANREPHVGCVFGLRIRSDGYEEMLSADCVLSDNTTLACERAESVIRRANWMPLPSELPIDDSIISRWFRKGAPWYAMLVSRAGSSRLVVPVDDRKGMQIAVSREALKDPMCDHGPAVVPKEWIGSPPQFWRTRLVDVFGESMKLCDGFLERSHLGLRVDRENRTIERVGHLPVVDLGSKVGEWHVFIRCFDAGETGTTKLRVLDGYPLEPAGLKTATSKLRSELIPLGVTIENRGFRLVESSR